MVVAVVAPGTVPKVGRHCGPLVEVLYFQMYGVMHVPEVRVNSWGTPILSSMFEQGEAHASGDAMMYINSDILLPPQ